MLLKTPFRGILLFFALAGTQLTSGQVFEGLVVPDKDVIISSRTEDVLVSREVKAGDNVREGQLLARLDSRIPRLEVARWEKQLELLESAYESARNLGRDNIVSREETLKAQIERDLAKIRLDMAQAELDDTELRSPIDGTVVEILKEPGEMIRRGEEVFRIVSTDIVFVQLYIQADTAAQLKEGMSIPVQFPSSEKLTGVEGMVDFIDPTIDPNSGFQKIRIKVKNPDNQIRSGQRCRVTISGE